MQDGGPRESASKPMFAIATLHTEVRQLSIRFSRQRWYSVACLGVPRLMCLPVYSVRCHAFSVSAKGMAADAAAAAARAYS